MTIQKAIILTATHNIAKTVNPKAQVGLGEICKLQQRGDWDAKQDQLADQVAFWLTADETKRVMDYAQALRE